MKKFFDLWYSWERLFVTSCLFFAGSLYYRIACDDRPASATLLVCCWAYGAASYYVGRREVRR